jgi:hypothetical protein
VVKNKVSLVGVMAVILLFSVGLATTLIGGNKKTFENIGNIAVRLVETDWEESKVAPDRPYDFRPIAAPSALLFEDFEGGVVPPSGWTEIIRNTVQNWDTLHYTYEGDYGARVYYDDMYTDTQDEWLVTPVIDLTTGGGGYYVYFYWMMSYYWGVDPYDNYDLELWISTDGGSNFTTKLWSESDVGVFTTWQWYRQGVDLGAYSAESNVKLAWRYSGYDGAQASVDFISVETPPVGRCCFGDPMSPSCEDVTEDSCNTLGGSWTYGMDCTNDPCPIVNPGDNCLNPIVINIPGDLPYGDMGQTTCGRGDDYNATCLGYYDGGEDIMYELNVSSAINIDIAMDPGSDGWTGICIDDECPPADPCMNFSTASSGTHNLTGIHLESGTYYIMVDTWPTPDCISSFDLTITEAAPPPPNDDCQNAEEVTSGQTVSGTTIGATVDCPGLLDWNAVWYKFDLPYACNYVKIDYCPTTTDIGLVGVVLYDECPADCPNYLSALADSGAVAFVDCPNGTGNPRLWWFNLQAGTYYFPAFVGAPMDFQFTITIQECSPYCYEAGGCDEYIERVEVGSIDNTSGCDLWSDFTSMSTDMLVGLGTPITITIGNSWSSDTAAVWVDWNQDYDFEDAGEEITMDVGSGYGPYTGTITPPMTADLGTTRMKIRLQYGGNPIPCGVTDYGEVEEYAINVLSPNAPPTCDFTPPGPFNVYEGEVVNFNVNGYDPDAGDVINITGTYIPSGATFTGATGTAPQSANFNWPTTDGDAGTYDPTFYVTDDDQEACTCNVSITVNDNAPPICTTPGSISVIAGNPINFTVTGTDPDGDEVTIDVIPCVWPPGATMNPPLTLTGPSPQSSVFSWTPDISDIGTYTPKFRIFDEHGLYVDCWPEIEVKEQPAVPTMTNLGLIILTLILVGLLGYMIFRRNRIKTID